MITNLVKKILVATAAISMLIFFIFSPYSFNSSALVASAAPTFEEISGIQNTGNVAGYVTGAEVTPINTIVSTIIFVVLSFVGVLFMGFIMYGAFTWMTSMGNSQQVEKANKIIMGALFGLMVTLAAYVISYFAIEYFWK